MIMNPATLLHDCSPDTICPSNPCILYQRCAHIRAVRSILLSRAVDNSRLNSEHRCIAVDPSSRVAGAISLWLVEIIMQMRVYALFNRNKKVGDACNSVF